MNNQTNTEATPAKKTARRPSRKQFALARRLAAETGAEIPQHAVFNAKAMSGFIRTNTTVAAS